MLFIRGAPRIKPKYQFHFDVLGFDLIYLSTITSRAWVCDFLFDLVTSSQLSSGVISTLLFFLDTDFFVLSGSWE